MRHHAPPLTATALQAAAVTRIQRTLSDRPFRRTEYGREFAVTSALRRPRSSVSSFTAVIPKITISGSHVVSGLTGVIVFISCKHAIRRK